MSGRFHREVLTAPIVFDLRVATRRQQEKVGYSRQLAYCEASVEGVGRCH